jgi:PIN domain nuclease of toxin-antitoxin system
MSPEEYGRTKPRRSNRRNQTVIRSPLTLGKLEADPNEVLAGVEPAGFSHLTIVGGHAAKVAELPPVHKDPFDRLLVAQARFEPMILLTDDEVLRAYGDLVEVV